MEYPPRKKMFSPVIDLRGESELYGCEGWVGYFAAGVFISVSNRA